MTAVDTAIQQRIHELVGDISAVRGDPEQERTIWIAGVHAVMELRADAGHPAPGELLGHILALDGWAGQAPAFELLDASTDEADRWADYIDEAAC